MGDELRRRWFAGRCRSGASWYVDETYLKDRSRWTYLYRAIDQDRGRKKELPAIWVHRARYA
ncbi:MAG: DDE-type integrase/transposase/recombinase, partial [Janthinobacterium lividum]